MSFIASVGYETFRVYFFVKFPKLPSAGTGRELICVIVKSMDWPMCSRSEVNKDYSQILYLFIRFSFHFSRELANLVSIYSSPLCFHFVSLYCIYNRFVFPVEPDLCNHESWSRIF